MKIIIICLLVVCLFAQEKVLYLHMDDNTQEPMDFSTVRNSPVFVPIDCRKSDCSRYKISQFPSIIYWKGPGSAFQKIAPADYPTALSYLKAKQIGIINGFKIFLEELSLFYTFVLAFFVASFLYTVFSLLFSPRQQKNKKE